MQGKNNLHHKVVVNEEQRSFYRFPAVSQLAGIKKQKLQEVHRAKRFAAVKRENVKKNQLKCLCICSRHFISGKPAKLLDVDNPDWVPRLNLGYKTAAASIDSASNRFKRNLERENKRNMMTQEIINAENDVQGADADGVQDADDAVKTCSVGTQTDLICENITDMERELGALRVRVAKLTLKEEAFVSQDKKVRHFTGLQSYNLLALLVMHMSSALTSIKVGRLDNFQKLVLVLMKLKMNTSFESLGYRFEIRLKDASKCCKSVIILLEHAFSAMVHWPDRESLRTVMPKSFKKAFGNSIAVIVDCFEITCQKPSNLKAKSQSFSQYKHNYTVKYLISITPQGVVSLISDGYGGHASDNFITQDCGLSDKLEFGDVVLADRGFTVKESFSVLYAELMTPDFMNGRKQLPPGAIERTRKIASVCIHVERVIGLVRNKFQILKGPIPIQFSKEKYADKCFLDYIVRVSCILTNMCDSIVPIQKSKSVNHNVMVALNTESFRGETPIMEWVSLFFS